MKRAAALLTAAAVLVAPASALAAPQLAAPIPTVRSVQAGAAAPVAPVDLLSGHRALIAYRIYLTGLLAAESSAQAGDTAFISTISGLNGCRGALAPLTQPGSELDAAAQHTLTVLGQEMGADLALSFDQAALPAFTRLSTMLSRLHWTRDSGGYLSIRHYISAESTVLQLSASNLCQDAALAATSPDRVPSGTRTFLRSYNRASSTANLALANLTKLMQSFETPAEKGLIARIANLTAQLASVTRTDLLQSGAALSNLLEST